MFKYHPNTQIWLNMCTHMITSPIVCGDRFEKKVFFLNNHPNKVYKSQ